MQNSISMTSQNQSHTLSYLVSPPSADYRTHSSWHRFDQIIQCHKNVFRSRVALTFCHLVLITGESGRLLQHTPKILLEVQVWTLWRSKMNHCCSFSTFRWSDSQPKPDQLIQPQILTLPPQACTVGTMHDGYITWSLLTLMHSSLWTGSIWTHQSCGLFHIPPESNLSAPEHTEAVSTDKLQW